MLNFYKTIDNKMVQLPKEEPGCWAMAVRPTEEELSYLRDEMRLDPGFLSASLDEEETSRTEKEEDQTFVVVDVPYQVEKDDEEAEEDPSVVFTTIPLGIIITPEYFVTISSKQSALLDSFAAGTVRGVQTRMRTRFLLTLLFRIAQRFLVHLRMIERISSSMEAQMHSSMKNEALIQLMGLQKSLVYISTSLRSNEATLKRISRGNLVTLYKEDEDLMQDVLIEIRQAMEMAEIYTNILSSTMDAYASIISNNLNIVMKVLTSVTVLMTIPTMVFSYYGMNVSGLQVPVWWFPTLVSGILALAALVLLIRFKMFK